MGIAFRAESSRESVAPQSDDCPERSLGEEGATITMPAGARVFWFVRRTVVMGWCEGCVWASRELCIGEGGPVYFCAEFLPRLSVRSSVKQVEC